MRIYHYNPVTKEYMGYSEADESPLEKGVFLVPAHATVDEPKIKAKSDEKVVFESGKWLAKKHEKIEEQTQTEPQKLDLSDRVEQLHKLVLSIADQVNVLKTEVEDGKKQGGD